MTKLRNRAWYAIEVAIIAAGVVAAIVLPKPLTMVFGAWAEALLLIWVLAWLSLVRGIIHDVVAFNDLQEAEARRRRYEAGIPETPTFRARKARAQLAPGNRATYH
jgi:hypothetical protein